MNEGLSQRVRRWLGRAKAAPARIDRLHAENEQLRERLGETSDALARLEDGMAALRSEIDRGSVVPGAEESSERVDRLDATIREEGALTRVAVADERRDAIAARLIDEHAHTGPLEAGLSIITITWNHAGFLDESIASGLAILDRQSPALRGEVLVLDDNSTDETQRVLERLTSADSRIKVIRSPGNLTLSRARNVLLHACRTSHAFVLDADNIGIADGVDALYSVAREWNSAFTYGNVVKARPDGSEFIPASNEPPTDAWLAGNYIDSMAVVDTAVLRRLGGYTLDPLLHSYDDYELVMRLARVGELLAFVPTVTGRYRILDTSYIEMSADSRVPLRRLERSYRSDGGLDPGDVAALAAHPATGPIWATPAAMTARPALIEALAGTDSGGVLPDGPRILVVSSGGFRNAGDDAMATQVIARIRRQAPDARIELVTDGDIRGDGPGRLAEQAVWAGTLADMVSGLDPNAVRSGCPDESLAEHIVAEAAVGTATTRPVDPSDYSMVMISGGGNLNEIWAGHAARRAALAAAAGVAGVPVVCSGQGVGPFSRTADEELRVVGYLIARSRAFGLRDPESVDLLRRHDLAPGHVALVGDDASGLPDAPSNEVDRALDDLGVRDGPFVAFHVRQAGYVGVDERDLESMAALVDDVAGRREASVLGVTTSDTPPRPESLSLAHLAHGTSPRRVPWRILECQHDPALLAAVLRRADAALVHSYHAALFSLERNTPTLMFVATDYARHKAEGLRRLTGLPAELVVDVSRALDRDDVEKRLDIVGEAMNERTPLVDTGAVDRFFRSTVTPLTEVSGEGRNEA